jgi:putative SOS response-associated peptidase YedK
MCNLYTQTRATDAMRALFEDRLIEVVPEAPAAPTLFPVEPAAQADIYPDYSAHLIRHAEGSSDGSRLVLDLGRWGMPTPPAYLEGKRVDKGVTNIRNTGSAHWRRWLGPGYRCLVPFDRFAEPGPGGAPVWFRPQGEGPAFFAGVTTVWTSVRKLKEGEVTARLFAFLTCPPNAEVGAVHPKAMPVILTEPAEWEAWLSAPWQIAAGLQRPLRDGWLVAATRAA